MAIRPPVSHTAHLFILFTIHYAQNKKAGRLDMRRPQTVKKPPSEKLRREEKCEREPSGFPFTFHNPAAAGEIAK